MTIDNHLESLRAKGLKYCAKLIKSGDMLELQIYPINPVWKARQGMGRAKSFLPARKEQKNLNKKNTRRHISRLVHANFTSKDIWLTFTYAHEHMPKDVQEATKHLKNYFKRLRRHIKKHNLNELKYIYVTERVENEKTGKVHTHHHIIMNFADRDTAESLWTLGGRTQSRRLQPDKDGSLEGLADYIAKPETKEINRKGAKSYAHSQNLKKPQIRRSENKMPLTDYRLSKKRIAIMATDENKAIAVFHTHYKGYKLTAPPKVIFSDYTAGVYIYAKLLAKEHNK